MKSYTDIEQSKKLSEILPLESADMCYLPTHIGDEHHFIASLSPYSVCTKMTDVSIEYCTPCWSLSSLLNILHSKVKDIPSLNGGGYKDGKYISDWCLDYEFENGDYQKTFADNPIDVCYEMILKLHELKML